MQDLTAVTAPADQAPPLTSKNGWVWPKFSDPRWPFALILLTYAVLGSTLLGFNRNPFQILLTTAVGALLDVGLRWLLKRDKVFPLSAIISCTSISLLLNYSHNYWLLFVPVFLTIGSKYVFTFKGKHVFNPSMFGVAMSLLVTNDLVTTAPAYQWGGTMAMSIFIVMAALVLFVFRIGRNPLIISFLVFYTLQTALRAWVMRHHLPPETLFLGTLTSAPFFIFTFYMLTDPQTSPKTAKGQVAFTFALTLVDLYLHFKESVFTFFYAALLMAVGKFLFLHGRAFVRSGPWQHLRTSLFNREKLAALGVVGGLGAGMLGGYQAVFATQIKPADVGFGLQRLTPEETGIHTEMGDVFHEVDPRLQHVAKWLLSVGDAVAVGDYDGDGRVDLFLTNPLKRPADRCALYRNMGGFRFERVSVPAFDAVARNPVKFGLASAASFADIDSDGDQDLFIAFGYGKSRLFENLKAQTGNPGFREITVSAGIDEHTTSLAGNFFDYDRDGKLDLLIANAVTPYLPEYKEPTPLNLFDLPQPEYAGDRRMFKFMHNGWHNADNGGLNALYRNLGNGRFEKQDVKAIGMPETHWTLAIGTGDLNKDGWTDLYLASDFGPDDLYLNKAGKGFERVEGQMFGDVGRDTYKGMNSTLADFDRNGYLDVYVSDVHQALQAEGSLLWMTRPTQDPFRPSFTDEATKRGALNERRFGWGAAAGDLNDDGWPDIVQANGMVDDRLDPLIKEGRKDYWYVNHKLMQSGPEIHTYVDMWGDLRGRTIYPNEARRVYLNRGDRDINQFVDVAKLVGADDPDNSRGVAMADFDDDGDLDVVITNMHGPVSIYRNELYGATTKPRTAWLGLTLVGDGKTTARQAVGSQVVVSYSEHGKKVEQLQEVQVMNGFTAQGDQRLHFGLGAHQGPVEVTVRWYGGKTETYRNVPTNGYRTLRQ